jgi:hypothetical protein
VGLNSHDMNLIAQAMTRPRLLFDLDSPTSFKTSIAHFLYCLYRISDVVTFQQPTLNLKLTKDSACRQKLFVRVELLVLGPFTFVIVTIAFAFEHGCASCSDTSYDQLPLSSL